MTVPEHAVEYVEIVTADVPGVCELSSTASGNCRRDARANPREHVRDVLCEDPLVPRIAAYEGP
jgi:hypothetical protein